MDLYIFQERLAKSRQSAKLNYKELSQKSGVTATAISYYEKGEKSPTLESAMKLAVALNVSLDWLCGLNKGENIENDNTALLRNFIYIFDEYEGLLENTPGTYPDTPSQLKMITFLPDDLYNFLEEYSNIRKLKKSSDIITDEMIETLKNALIDKYKSNILTWKQWADSLPF
ncbi:MAG: helix-turn-helix transcriptional regulator [Clostridia bacterium]|nr:helix-turn-helix transcriptional regulator [Clostridia bacterium]